jgi:hypothetical protein
MANITPVSVNGQPGSITYTWSMGDADTGIAVESGHLPDKHLQVIGTTWDSATLVIQGSNDGANWVTLKAADSSSTTLSITTGSPEYTILSNPKLIRPSTSGGAGTADITISINMRA